MAGNLWQCLMALGWLGFVSLAGGNSIAAELVGLSAGGRENSLAGFVVRTGRELVSVVPAGVDLQTIKPGNEPVPGLKLIADPVSRIVVSGGMVEDISGMVLAERAPDEGFLLVAAGGGRAGIEGRVSQHGGGFLPFAMLRLQYPERIPRPGTPLLDEEGRVAAVHYQGVEGGGGFAIPVEVVTRVLAGIRRHGEVTRSWIGLTLDPADHEPRVTRVIEGSPAARGGLEAGDLLMEACGRTIGSYGDAVNALFFLMPGEKTDFRVRRGRVILKLNVIPAKAGS